MFCSFKLLVITILPNYGMNDGWSYKLHISVRLQKSILIYLFPKWVHTKLGLLPLLLTPKLPQHIFINIQLYIHSLHSHFIHHKPLEEKIILVYPLLSLILLVPLNTYLGRKISNRSSAIAHILASLKCDQFQLWSELKELQT